jgi:Iodothyronine deiodinase
MAARYGGRVHFLAVYIREAHPEDGWILPENRRSGLSVREPKTDEERRAVASTCATKLLMKMPMAVDGVDNRVASAYGGWPDRLYLVSRDGRIAFQGGEGPFGFKPEELERAIERELAT